MLGRSFKSASKGSSSRVSGSEMTEGADGTKKGAIGSSMLGFQKMLQNRGNVLAGGSGVQQHKPRIGGFGTPSQPKYSQQ